MVLKIRKVSNSLPKTTMTHRVVTNANLITYGSDAHKALSTHGAGSLGL